MTACPSLMISSIRHCGASLGGRAPPSWLGRCCPGSACRSALLKRCRHGLARPSLRLTPLFAFEAESVHGIVMRVHRETEKAGSRGG